jgi:hypothetical protein
MGIKAGDGVVIMSGPPHNRKTISIIPEIEFNKVLEHLDGHVKMLKRQSLAVKRK